MEKYPLRILSLVGIVLLSAFGGGTHSIGDAAQNLMEPTAILTKLVLITCYIVGVALLFMAFAQYRIHRQSPKLVPLGTPITLLLLGLLSLGIPAGTHLFGDPHSAEDEAPRSKVKSPLPLPDVGPKGPKIPAPERSRFSLDRSPEPPAAPPPPDDKGYWWNQ